ncbi:MAG: hypothetical protein RLZZ152_820 [Pseudomonadota bacterium]
MIHPMHAIKQMNLHALGLVFIIFSMSFLPCTAKAQNNLTETSAIIGEADQIYYTLGTRLKSNDMGDWQNTARVRPVIGLRYGKWQLGIGDGRAWRNLGQFGSEPTLSYQVMDEPDLNIGLSMRVHNVSTGESFDVFEGGKNTLRTRVMMHRKINKRWRLNVDWTQDILNKGDGTTLNLGLSYAWPVFQQSELILHADSTWATAEHWRNSASYVKQGPLDLVSTGFQKVSAGLTFKQSISRHWAWYSTFAISQPIAELKKVQAREISSGQIGILYFQR